MPGQFDNSRLKASVRTIRRLVASALRFSIGYIRDLFSAQQAVQAPLASVEDAKTAEIVVSCYDNWRGPGRIGNSDSEATWDCFLLAARLSTPGGRCVWDDVAVERGETPKPD